MVGEDEFNEMYEGEYPATSLYGETIADEGGYGQELTEIDYRPKQNQNQNYYDNLSSQFTDNATGAEDYDFVDRSEENVQESELEDESNEVFNDDYNDTVSDVDESNENADENAEEDDEEDSDVANFDSDSIDDESEDVADIEKEESQQKNIGNKKQDNIIINGVRLWKKGEPITFDVLVSHWDLFYDQVSSVHVLMKQADFIIEQRLNNPDPDIVMLIRVLCKKAGMKWRGMISNLLDLVSHPGKLLTFNCISATLYIIFQQWRKLPELFKLKKTLKGILNESIVQDVIKKVFIKATHEIKIKLNKERQK